MRRTAAPVTLLSQFDVSLQPGPLSRKTDALAAEVLSPKIFCNTSRLGVPLLGEHAPPHCSHSLGFEGLKPRLATAARALLAEKCDSRSRGVAKKFRLRHLKHESFIFDAERLWLQCGACFCASLTWHLPHPWAALGNNFF